MFDELIKVGLCLQGRSQSRRRRIIGGKPVERAVVVLSDGKGQMQRQLTLLRE
jgi:hypothetical protein